MYKVWQKITKESKMKVCTKCNRYCYCPKECQVDDWKRHKRQECLDKKGGNFCAEFGAKGTIFQPNTDHQADTLVGTLRSSTSLMAHQHGA